MFIVQKRESLHSQWKTCSANGRKCRFEEIAIARIAYRKLKTTTDKEKHPNIEFRIIDSESNEEVD